MCRRTTAALRCSMRVSSSLVTVLRVCGALIFGLLGWYVADLIPFTGLPVPLNNTLVFHAIMGVGVGIVATVLVPPILSAQLRRFLDEVSRASGAQIIADFVGFTTGLLIAALLAFPLALLPDPFRGAAAAISHHFCLHRRDHHEHALPRNFHDGQYPRAIR